MFLVSANMYNLPYCIVEEINEKLFFGAYKKYWVEISEIFCVSNYLSRIKIRISTIHLFIWTKNVQTDICLSLVFYTRPYEFEINKYSFIYWILFRGIGLGNGTYNILLVWFIFILIGMNTWFEFEGVY